MPSAIGHCTYEGREREWREGGEGKREGGREGEGERENNIEFSLILEWSRAKSFDVVAGSTQVTPCQYALPLACALPSLGTISPSHMLQPQGKSLYDMVNE